MDIPFDMALQEGIVQPGNVAGVDFHSVYSSNFLLNGVSTRFEDDGLGHLYIVSTFNGVEQFVNQVGTVDYDSGLVRLINFKVDEYDGLFIKVYVRTREKDILENKATILDIEAGEMQIAVNVVRE